MSCILDEVTLNIVQCDDDIADGRDRVRYILRVNAVKFNKQCVDDNINKLPGQPLQII